MSENKFNLNPSYIQTGSSSLAAVTGVYGNLNHKLSLVQYDDFGSPVVPYISLNQYAQATSQNVDYAFWCLRVDSLSSLLRSLLGLGWNLMPSGSIGYRFYLPQAAFTQTQLHDLEALYGDYYTFIIRAIRIAPVTSIPILISRLAQVHNQLRLWKSRTESNIKNALSNFQKQNSEEIDAVLVQESPPILATSHKTMVSNISNVGNKVFYTDSVYAWAKTSLTNDSSEIQWFFTRGIHRRKGQAQ